MKNNKSAVTDGGISPRLIIGWAACRSRFEIAVNGQRGMYAISNKAALQHWINGTALFLENAQRVVSQLAADYDGPEGADWTQFLQDEVKEGQI